MITRSTHFKCIDCEEWTPKDEGLAIRVNYTTIYKPISVKRSRTMGYKCLKCLESDEIYNREPYEGSRKPRPQGAVA